jgi:hypothetical protein
LATDNPFSIRSWNVMPISYVARNHATSRTPYPSRYNRIADNSCLSARSHAVQGKYLPAWARKGKRIIPVAPGTVGCCRDCATLIRTTRPGTSGTRTNRPEPGMSDWAGSRTCRWPRAVQRRPGGDTARCGPEGRGRCQGSGTQADRIHGNHALTPYTHPQKVRTWDDEYYRLHLKAAFGHRQFNPTGRREVQLIQSTLPDE